MAVIRVVVVGAGISGLSTAWFLTRVVPPDLNVEVRLIDQRDRVGGRVQSVVEEGYVHEWGPHGFLDNEPDTLTLVDALLPDRRIVSRDAARRRFVVHQGRLVAVPTSPVGLLTTPLLSPRGRLRFLREPFVEKRGNSGPIDESLADFARRRFGEESVDSLFDPFATGIYAGDVQRLSVQSAFPRFARLEAEYGSVIRGGIASMKARRKEGKRGGAILCSFPNGMGELPEAILAALGPERFIDGEVRAIDSDGDGFAVEVDGDGIATLRADVVVLAVPTGVAEKLVLRVDPDLSSNLALTPHAGMTVVGLTYDRRQVRGDLESFGFLVPAREGRPILGCIVASSVFEGHAPDGKVSLRVMVGGVRNPELIQRGEEELVELAHRELQGLLRIDGEPEASRVSRHPRAIPQYNVGHALRLAAIDGRLRHSPRLYLTGAGYRGVGVNDCVREGRSTAQKVIRFLLSDDQQAPGFLG